MPITSRGLGVKNMIQFNRTFLGKWLWRYAMEREAMWRSMVATKYDSLMGGWCSMEVAGLYGVGVWKCMRKRWEGFSTFVRYELDLRCGFGRFMVWGAAFKAFLFETI
jgi:hypothetical protein